MSKIINLKLHYWFKTNKKYNYLNPVMKFEINVLSDFWFYQKVIEACIVIYTITLHHHITTFFTIGLKY